MTRPIILSAIAVPALALLSACGEEQEPADTSFEQAMPPPVPVEDGPGPVPDNAVGLERDEVPVDYADGSDPYTEGPYAEEDRSPPPEEVPQTERHEDGADVGDLN